MTVGLDQIDIDRCAFLIDKEVVLATRLSVDQLGPFSILPACTVRAEELFNTPGEKVSVLVQRNWVSTT